MIRLDGIDAPELGQRCKLPAGGTWGCDEAAVDRLAEIIGTSSAECDGLDRDAYNRVIARCTVGETDIGEAWAEGLAGGSGATARSMPSGRSGALAQIGIWQAPTQPPWDYRADRWERAAEASPRRAVRSRAASTQRVSASTTRPGRARTSTQIKEADGECWFCNEAEALAAGWRAPKVDADRVPNLGCASGADAVRMGGNAAPRAKLARANQGPSFRMLARPKITNR